MTTTRETEPSKSVAVTRLAAYGTVAAIVASAVNVLVRTIALAAFDVPAGFGPLGWGPVVTTTVVGVAGATGVYSLLTRVSARPSRTFTIVAAVVLVASFAPLVAPPPFLVGAPRPVLVTLATMHVTTAAVVVGLLPRATGSGAGSR